MGDLPIEASLAELKHELERNRLVVLEAPPGAGKTTRVPIELLDEAWLDHERIVLLEPRRVAARAAATRMAHLLDERVGERVGLRTRLDTRVSAATRLEVVTEGVLTRMLIDDPGLTGTGLVIFDEFHERSLYADTGLAFTLDTASALREDLRVLIMSATLNTRQVTDRLGVGAVVRSEGQAFPVSTEYRPPEPGSGVESEALAAACEVLRTDGGDVLVFLPGAGSINRVARQLREAATDDTVVTPLHGGLAPSAQDRALQPDPEGRRKVVLATSIAQTSVTIDGIRVVIDSGQSRRPRIDLEKGLSGLMTVSSSRASADQRRGRAGRQAPGRCIRLWAEVDQQHRRAEDLPEILVSDLTDLALDLAAWGVDDADDLIWLDAPPPAALTRARSTLSELGAIDDGMRITDHGRAMTTLGAPARLAHMMLTAHDLGWTATACDIAALLIDRDVLRGRRRTIDIRARLEALVDDPADETDDATLGRARRTTRRWRKHFDVGDETADLDLAGVLTSIAYPDRIAQRRRRGDGSFLLTSGAGASTPPGSELAGEPFLAVAEIEGLADDARITIASPLTEDQLAAVHHDRIQTRTTGGWDRRRRDVVFENQERLGALVLSRDRVEAPDADAVTDALCIGLQREGLGMLPWTDRTNRLRDRLAFLHTFDPDEWPAVDEQSLLAHVDVWLAPFLAGVSRRADLVSVDLRRAIESLVGARRARDVERLAPTHFTVPSGSRIPIDYSAEGGPVLAARLQEMFGLSETPTIVDGRVPLVVHLLSPAHRPVQVTTDLASFWRNGYGDVRRELRGRYPRHDWPEDPTNAAPTRRAKPRR